jgi:hypothetical protein
MAMAGCGRQSGSASTDPPAPSASHHDAQQETGQPTEEPPSTPDTPDINDTANTDTAPAAVPEQQSPAEERPAARLDDKPGKFRDAVAFLGSPRTWCKGARKLAILGDKDAIIPLLRAYQSRAESSKACLLDAMEALGAVRAAHDMAQSHDDEEVQRMGLYLMSLVTDASHIPVLEPIAARVELSDRLRAQALKAMATQRQTPEWEAAMIRLLAARPRATRAQAIQSLSQRRTDPARAALKARAAVETDPTLKAQLEALVH